MHTLPIDGHSQISSAQIKTALGVTKFEREIFIFDFDGVLISNVEERIYRLPPYEGERQELLPIAKHYGIIADLYDIRYTRHLVVQAIMADMGGASEIGPLAEFANHLSAKGLPVFVLTARSGAAPVARALKSLEQSRIGPQEVFFVGRVAKGRQLAMIAKEHATRRVVYFDDSVRHARNAAALSHDNVSAFYVKWPKVAPQEAEKAYRCSLEWFLGAHHGKRRPTAA